MFPWISKFSSSEVDSSNLVAHVVIIYNLILIASESLKLCRTMDIMGFFHGKGLWPI